MKIVSFNLHGDQYDRDGHDIEQRAERLQEILLPIKADVYFFKECTIGMLKAVYKIFDDKYIIHDTFQGDLMDTTILWNPRNHECIETGYFWLSDTPDEYSRSWDNFRRYCNYVSLKDRKTGKCFTCVSVHVGMREETQQKSVKVICDYVEKITGYPTIIAGTFNSRPDSVAYKTMCEKYIDVNAVTAKDYRTTYHKFEPHLWPDDHVDYCFVSKEFMPISYKMLDKRYPQVPGKYPLKYEHRYPSDHYGLECEIDL